MASAVPKYGECGRSPRAVSSPKRSSCRILPGSCSWKSSRTVGLAGGEHAQRGRGQPGQVGQRLEARDQAVAAEQRHEPRQSGRGQRGALGEVGMQPQRAEIAEARAVGARQRRVLGLASTGAPASHASSSADLAALQLVERCPAARAARTRRPAARRSGVIVKVVDHCSPGASSQRRKRSPSRVTAAGLAGGDRDRAPEAGALVGERQRRARRGVQVTSRSATAPSLTSNRSAKSVSTSSTTRHLGSSRGGGWSP